MSSFFHLTFYTDNADLQSLITADERKDIYEADLIEGNVAAVTKSQVFVDIPGYGMGIIYGREFMNSKEIIKNLNIGDTIKGKIIERENEDGYIELSLKEARQALLWKEVENAIREKTVFNLPVKAANKGGVIVSWQGIDGFLPASQLKEAHYPRVSDGDKEEILKELKKLVGEVIPVTMIASNAKEGKLIFSEKGEMSGEKAAAVAKYAVGDVVDGVVTGAVDFGLFLKIENGLEGLVHISEIAWSLVESPKSLYSVGDKVQAKVIETKADKISLSIKALKQNPWVEAAKKYPKGTNVSGVVLKYNKHGALVAIEEGISGLVHVSEFEDETGLRSTLEIGKAYPFTISLINSDEQRMALTFGK